MASSKRPLSFNVLEAARMRVRYAFDHFERIYVSFSAGKDSSVMLHLVMDEAVRRKRKVGVLFIDLEAQYQLTIEHAREMFAHYAAHIDPYWVCLPIKLRNSVSNYEPVWCCWQPERKDEWVRPMPAGVISDPAYFDFFEPMMEFEEFMVLFGVWYARGADTAAFIGIRADESLNRFRTIADRDKAMHFGKQYTTEVAQHVFNVYPIYDWRVEDIWRFHAQYPDRAHNAIYDRMHMAGVPLSNMRLCQPYGDDQRRGLWLFHLLEPQTWSRIVARVNGANGGALYVQEQGDIMGYGQISKPDGHTWQSFSRLLFSTMPPQTRKHYAARINEWIQGWQKRGYASGIPDEAPRALEKKYWVPSWRRVCRVLLRNDWWCKGLGGQQPKSAAYQKYLERKRST